VGPAGRVVGTFTYTVHFAGGESLTVGEAAAEELLRVINSEDSP
jgi:hypothetical protein